MASRADKRTRIEKYEEMYSDFDSSFSKNPVTGVLLRVTNDDAVKQSIRNIILASRGEWAYHPTLGSKIYHMLFEPLDSVTADNVAQVISTALKLEPRARIESVKVEVDHRRDGYDVTIVFRTINSTRPVEFKDFLKRVR